MRNKLIKLILSASVAASAFAGYNSAFAIERVSVAPETTNKKAPAINMFKVKGHTQRYILLDETDEGFFVMAEKSCASRKMANDGVPTAFDPENENSVAHWLNNTYLYDKSVSNRLPDVIIENLIEKEYLTEGGGNQVSFKTDYKTKCKVVVLSQTEWSKYNAKFGYGDDTTISYWALRSVRSNTGNPLIAYTSGTHAGVTQDGKWTSPIGLRPAFWVSKDFFSKAVLDVENTGDAILSMLRADYSREELSKLYNTEELYAITESDFAPTAGNIIIKGKGIVGEKVVGTYKFNTFDQKAENGTTVQWQKSADKKTWSTILGADTTEYTPTEKDVGYYLKMTVTPMTAVMSGAVYESQPMNSPIMDISIPEARDVRIENANPAKPGVILDAKYSYYDENHVKCSETEYIWEASADMASSEKVGAERYFKLTNNEAGKYVRVGVIPKKKASLAEDSEAVAGELVYSDWIRIENLPVISEVSLIRDANLTVTVSKTEESVTVNGLLNPIFGNTERITAVYDKAESNEYTVVCQWQGAKNKDGEYFYIASGSDCLEFAPDGPLWVRARVYTKNDKNVSDSIYSEPILIGSEKNTDINGEYTLTQSLIKGKTYEIRILNESAANGYAYSFRIEGAGKTDIISDKCIINKDGNSVIASVLPGTYNGGYCFTAGNITPTEDITVTISDAMTTDSESNAPSMQAKVYIAEKE